MGFFTPDLAVCQVRWHHRHEEVLEMIGTAYEGLSGTDRGSSYEAAALSNIEQQKCLSHLLKNLSMAEKTCRGRAKCFARDLKAVLRKSLALRGGCVASGLANLIHGRPMPAPAGR